MGKYTKKRNTKEEKEMEDAFRSMTGQPAQEKTSRFSGTALVICIAIAAIVVCLGSVFFFLVEKEMSKVIVGNVSVAGVQLQGMQQGDAIAAVKEAAAQKYASYQLTVTAEDNTITLPAECISGLDARKAVQAAYNGGLVNAPTALDLSPYLKVDEDAIRQQLSTLAAIYNTPLQECTYQIIGQEPNQILQITLGTPEYNLDVDQLYKDVLAAYSSGLTTLEAKFTLQEPAPIDLEAIQAAHCRIPVDAYYDKAAKKIVGGEEGYGFTLEAAQQALLGAQYGQTVDIPLTSLSPAITLEAATEALFADTLGTFTAKSSSQSNRDTNLRLACESINGIILYPGDSFSYNETLGERTPDKGYKPAGTYIGNETVNTYGGGICQVSSSLYYSALCAELEIIERTNHGFLPSYMPRGLDATVNWGTLDFRFKNNLDYPIRIEATAQRGTTTVTIKGTETRSYRVELDATIITKTPYETEYQVMTADNKEGYKDGEVIVTPHSGYYVESYIYKYELNSDKLISKEYIDDSTYRIRNKVVCKIEGETPVPPAEDTPSGGETPPATDTSTETP